MNNVKESIFKKKKLIYQYQKNDECYMFNFIIFAINKLIYRYYLFFEVEKKTYL